MTIRRKVNARLVTIRREQQAPEIPLLPLWMAVLAGLLFVWPWLWCTIDQAMARWLRWRQAQ